MLDTVTTRKPHNLLMLLILLNMYHFLHQFPYYIHVYVISFDKMNRTYLQYATMPGL
jgi:hypothetical protein